MDTFRDLSDFLRNYKAGEGDIITHTRIGDGKNVYGGKYSIPADKMELFNKLYHRDVFVKEKHEYLTEVQLKTENSPVLIDLDFRYETSVKKRIHEKEHIDDIVLMYHDAITNLTDIDTEYPIYVLEKDNVNQQEKVTKDGIHLVIGVACDNVIQQIIRNKALKEIDNVIGDLNLINDADSVLDSGISIGHTNWQMYGSRKPSNEAYKLKYTYNCSFNKDEDDVTLNNLDNSDDHLKMLNIISARNSNFIQVKIKDEYADEYKYLKENTTKKKRTVKKQKKITSEGFNFDVSEISSKEILEQLVEKLLTDVSTEEYNLKETHNFLMALPEQYYNDYDKWIRCGWALHNTNFKLFISWMYFSSQSDKFNFDDISSYYDTWQNMKDNGFTNRSIMYWVREENPLEYKKVRDETIDYYIELTEHKATEWDVAQVLYQLYKDEYRCASLKHKIWYHFRNHRWREIDSGTTLRYSISKTLSRIYANKADKCMCISNDLTGCDPEKQEQFRKKSTNFCEISSNLKRTTYKQNIMKEAAEIFFEADTEFSRYLDTKRHLLCFNNGVWDFEEGVFRDGRPDDYLSLTTHINYYPYSDKETKNVTARNEINDFMTKLFPVDELRRYMWEHLASTLIGKNKSQTFNIYNGCGRNGKSKLVDLMSIVLGDYKGVVPITIVTQKRNNIGALSPEIAALKGIRYAVMQEPSKGDKLNDGIMKELTGEDPIQGRALYKEHVTFIPQFKLVVCTNNLFDIKSNDDGTWRRIRLCEFLAKFVKEPNPTEESPYEFEVDQDIAIKFEQWKFVFIDMLVQLALKKNGIVTDCDMVMQASNEYRKGQDYLMEFLSEKIEKFNDPDVKIKKTEVYSEFKVWYQETYGKNIPKGKELYDFLDKKLGKNKMSGWHGYRIKYNYSEENQIESVIDI